MYRLQRSCTLRSRAPNLLQSKEEVQYIESVITDSLSSVQVKTRLACFSFLLLKFVFAAHFCASEFSLPEFRLFVLLRRTSFQESSGSVYYSIFDFQGTIFCPLQDSHAIITK